MPKPLTDAINALTTYANGVTGAADANLSDAVYTLAHGFGGESAFTIQEITVGTNTVTTTKGARDYFFSDFKLGNYLLLKENPTTQNQLVCLMDIDDNNNVAICGRYRNGAIGSAGVNDSYDGALVEGTTYYKIQLK